MPETVVVELALPRDMYMALQQAASRRHKTEAELVVEALHNFWAVESKDDPVLGLFADEPELIDEIMFDITISRQKTPLRTTGQTDEQIAS